MAPGVYHNPAPVLNEYFNRVIADHDDDDRSFFLQNRRISPNPYVLRVMKEAAGI